MQVHTSAMALAKVGDFLHGNVNIPVNIAPTGPYVRFEQIDLSPRGTLVVKILDGFTLPKLLPEWPGIPDVARQPLFWMHAFFFITCEYGVSMVVNGGQPWWVEKVLLSLAWGAFLACLPSAAASIIRRTWGTRLRVCLQAQTPQPTALPVSDSFVSAVQKRLPRAGCHAMAV